MAKEYINPETLHKPSGYYHVVKSGNIVFIAGQVGLDQDGQIVGDGNIEVQASQVLANLEAAIKSAGGTKEDIVSTTTYIINRDDIPGVRKSREGFFENAPTSTLVIVSALARPEFLIEIEARAIIGDSCGC
jgi:enamine deaminase RidA (YjgF/YER057c/UK114 family)